MIDIIIMVYTFQNEEQKKLDPLVRKGTHITNGYFFNWLDVLRKPTILELL